MGFEPGVTACKPNGGFKNDSSISLKNAVSIARPGTGGVVRGLGVTCKCAGQCLSE